MAGQARVSEGGAPEAVRICFCGNQRCLQFAHFTPTSSNTWGQPEALCFRVVRLCVRACVLTYMRTYLRASVPGRRHSPTSLPSISSFKITHFLLPVPRRGAFAALPWRTI